MDAHVVLRWVVDPDDMLDVSLIHDGVHSLRNAQDKGITSVVSPLSR